MAKDTIGYIVGKVNEQLVDAGFIRWPQDELIGYFYDAQRAVMIIRPDSYVIEDTFVCAQGTKQELPDNALRLVDIRPTQTSQAIISKDKSEITELYPDWFGTTDETEPEAFIYDERQPKTFFLFPGVNTGLVIEIVYSAIPPVKQITEMTDDADLDNIYSNPIMQYMLYLAHGKDFEYSEQAKAQTHYQMFSSLMGLKSQSDAGMTPTSPANKE